MKARQRVRALAYRLADSTAKSDIECHTLEVDGDDLRRYYDTTTADVEDKTFIDEALEYLQLRGMLERHPRKPHLVRFKERRDNDEEAIAA